jgi:heme exporter protein B
LINDILKNLKKEFTIEFRNRSALYIPFIFSAVTAISVSLASGAVPFSSKVNAVLFWLISFFSAMNSLSRSFMREEEEKTSLFLHLISSPSAIFTSKLIFSLIYFTALQILLSALFIFFMQVDIKLPLEFFIVSVSGGIALACSATILGALTAKAGTGVSVFSIISFPLILPVLFISILLTSSSIEGSLFNYGNVIFLLAFSGSVTALSFILYRHIR